MRKGSKLYLVLVGLFVVTEGIEDDLQQCHKNDMDCPSSQPVAEETDIYPDLIGLDQDDPALIEAIKSQILLPPSKHPIKVSESSLSGQKIKGQFGQAGVVDRLVSRKKSGFFIEAGACDGESISNSLYFEVLRKWTGLLVEPNPDFLKLLREKNRKAWILPHCLSPGRKSVVVPFDAHLFNGGIINTENSDRPKPGDIGRQPGKKVPPQINKRTIKVQCFPLYSVLMALGNPQVDYFSLDIEGAEFKVLESLPWKSVDISVVGVEVEHAGKVFDGREADISKLLIGNGYQFREKAGHDSFYVRNLK